jgi:putative methionine-R-sulfoxide reductase with GAF domain
VAVEHPLTAITDAATAGGSNTERAIRLEDITASSGEVVALFALAQSLSGNLALTEVGRQTFEHLRRLVPHAFGVLFVYLEASDELTAAYASGESSSLVTGMRVQVGERLSGWVAASRQTIRNSDPVLDLGEAAKTLSPRPRSCLSTPLIVSKDLTGVLTIYSKDQNFFSEEHERLLEAVARQVAPAVSRAVGQSSGAAIEKRTGHLENQHDGLDRLPDRTSLALIETREKVPAFATGQLQAIAEALSGTVTQKDVVFRRGPRQLAVLCSGLDDTAITRTIAEVVSSMQDVMVVLATTPKDGRSLEQLLASADQLLLEQPGSGPNERRSIH